MVTEEHQCWLSKLLGYDFKIQYRLGLENKAIDALSRLMEEPLLAILLVPNVLDYEILQNEIEADAESGRINGALQ